MRSFGDLPNVLRVLGTAADRAVRWRLAIALLLVVAGSLLAGLAPLALKGLVDAVTGTQDPRHRNLTGPVLTFGAAYLLALAGGRLLGETGPLVIGAAEQRLYGSLRRRFFGHLLDLPLAFHLGRRTGALVHSLEQATTGYQLIIAHLVHSIVPVLVEIATVTVVLAHLGQPVLMANFAAGALAHFAALSLGNRPLGKRAQVVSVASLNARAMLTDGLLNYETIKCFGAESTARDRLADASRELENGWTALHRQRARIALAASTTFALSMGASLLIAADAVARGTLTIGGFVLANVYMLQLLRPLEMAGAAARDLSQALAFIRPLLELLNEPTEMARPAAPAPEREPGEGAPEVAPTIDARAHRRRAPAVSFRGVRFAYDERSPVLQQLDLDIAARRSVAIVGISGSGKSTVARLLLRLCDPQAGQILLDQVAIDRLHVSELRAMIGVVPQDTVLFNDTIAFNIGVGKAGARLHEIESAARLAQLHDFIASLPAGYDTPVGERGLRLSGGERQRVAIARAVIRRPVLYVFDEATSMLDSQTEGAILRNLQELAEGCTTITIAHRLWTVQHADEILVLDAGRVAERGDHAALLARGETYARLWRRQLHGDLA